MAVAIQKLKIPFIFSVIAKLSYSRSPHNNLHYDSSAADNLVSVFTQQLNAARPKLNLFAPILTPPLVESVLTRLPTWKLALSFFQWASDQHQYGYRHNCYTYNTIASIFSRSHQTTHLKTMARTAWFGFTLPAAWETPHVQHTPHARPAEWIAASSWGSNGRPRWVHTETAHGERPASTEGTTRPSFEQQQAQQREYARPVRMKCYVRTCDARGQQLGEERTSRSNTHVQQPSRSSIQAAGMRSFSSFLPIKKR
ncbi:hypothetical protein VIGAN_10130700 [Vigna angularis var. angularis]|uniref:Uncharacterized protein n=1 Tax=Vigna angularis var. angularis TaxID=157739 RepID=A0A0S3T4G8_PHAAN|nr:hypothetical protein VIGAN_10130700 [Vigna angularis var. angularis]